MDKGFVFWITGLSGAGKTTIGQHLYNHIAVKKRNVVFLDGDVLRETFGNDLGHSREDRLKSAMRNARLCKLLSDQGLDVVCATISLFNQCQEWNRSNIERYIEIFIDAPIAVLQERDAKGIYAKSNAKDIVGVDIQHECPTSPHVRLLNDGSQSIEVLLDLLLNQLDALRGA